MTSRHFSSSMLLILATVVLASAVAAHPSNECVYTLYVQTGSIVKAGTDSRISVTLGDSAGKSVWIPNLRDWGLMGPQHDYFERGSLDIFTGRGPCISSPVCRLNLTSDGSGAHHGWYCDYIEVTSTGPHKACSQSIFYVEQWLATDAPPYELTAVLDGCKRMETQFRERRHGPFALRKSSASE
ncbi:PLAT domain-containing protein 3-like [Coffea arabica]|uniref:PLAT domain-containing protein 3-like n=1 Tax=Coffea arabica TaxID=13443 RepID=A0A6P6WJJ0_COFAR|nr:PLAT domain-containing protein 3-like [Coffea arabica]XP_027115603.1 PLAT domain-containing protein 3-like [Coffea arabica]